MLPRPLQSERADPHRREISLLANVKPSLRFQIRTLTLYDYSSRHRLKFTRGDSKRDELILLKIDADHQTTELSAAGLGKKKSKIRCSYVFPFIYEVQ